MSDERVTGIGGVFFKAQNPAELATWYAKHLGIKLEGGTPDPDHDGAVSAVFEWREKATPDTSGSTVWALFPAGSDYLGDGHVMVNYRVADMESILAALEAEGVWVDPHREHHEYGRFAWIRDPEGNRVELWEPVAES